MVSTRSTRKRESGEVNAISGGVKTRNQHNNNNNNDNVITSELSFQPKTKRQRTAIAATLPSKKARALKPVAANVKKNSKLSRSTKATAALKLKSKSNPNEIKTATNTSKKRSSSSNINGDDCHQRRGQRKKQRKTGVKTATIADAEPVTKCVAKDDTIDDTNGSHTALSIFDNRLRNNTSRSKESTDRKSSCSSFFSRLSGNQNSDPDDIDVRDRNDPASATDYVQEMYEHFRDKEEVTSVDRMYMGPAHAGKQPFINESMRCILVDWLIEVHYKFKLFPETLYLTVNILDRFLSESAESITKRDLQLVGVTALLISSKYEEMYIPELRDLTYICDGAYTEAKILRMEEKILKTLDYNVTVPTPYTFMVRFLKAAHADKLMSQITNFVLDGTLLSLEHLTCVWRPSELAAAAVMIARRAVGRLNWSPTLMKYTLYDEEEIVRVARAVLIAKNRLDGNRELLALQKKYSKNKYGKVSHYKFAPIEDSFKVCE